MGRVSRGIRSSHWSAGARIGARLTRARPDPEDCNSDLDRRAEMQPEEGGFLVRRDGSGHKGENPLCVITQVHGAAPSGRRHLIPEAAGAAPDIFIVSSWRMQEMFEP